METVDTSHDIHRPAVAIEKLLTTGKGGVSYETREAGKVGHGNDNRRLRAFYGGATVMSPVAVALEIGYRTFWR